MTQADGFQKCLENMTELYNDNIKIEIIQLIKTISHHSKMLT